MFSIQNIALLSDIIRLPKEILREVCTDLDIPSNGTVTELSESIWTKIHNNPDLQISALEKCKSRILCGRTSVTWFELSTADNLTGAKDIILRNSGFNPFETIRIPPRENLTTTPVLISAAIGESENQYFLRFMYKSGVSRDFYGTSMEVRARSSIGTVYIDEEQGKIEIRTNPKSVEKIVSSLAELMEQRVSITQKNILAPFGNSVEEFADVLNGELIDAEAKPEVALEEFNEDQARAIVSILSALDNYFKEGEIDKLQEDLNQASEVFGEELVTIPFTALIVSGMEKVGMGVSDRDLRGLPLYDLVKPYLQHQGGYIQFPIVENGVERKHTIRVGLTTKSVYFVTPASENVIAYVRQRI